jgi:hypothetical protein
MTTSSRKETLRLLQGKLTIELPRLRRLTRTGVDVKNFQPLFACIQPLTRKETLCLKCGKSDYLSRKCPDALYYEKNKIFDEFKKSLPKKNVRNVNIEDPENPTAQMKLQEIVLENCLRDSEALVSIIYKEMAAKIVKEGGSRPKRNEPPVWLELLIKDLEVVSRLET